MTAVEVRDLSKNYPISGSPLARLRHVMNPGKAGVDYGLWALRDVSFTVQRGEAFGIIGANGSGKSTLLQIIAGILRPTAGTVEVNGRLSALLELGSGFSPEFTGRDNVYLNASILGLSREDVDARFSEIEAFAEIGDFIDQPVKTLSTGMVLRLAFAVAAHVDSEILIVDEVLAVGDIGFRQRCMRRIHELRARGATILFVSHETMDIKALCERCLWLQNGAVRHLGEADEVVARYLSATLKKELANPAPEPESRGAEVALELPGQSFERDPALERQYRYGDGRAVILKADLTESSGTAIRTIGPSERVIIRIRFRVTGRIDSPIAGFLLRNAKGENILASNTARENYPMGGMLAGEEHTIDFHWTAPGLAAGAYSISVGINDGNIEQSEVCEYVEDAIRLNVVSTAFGNSFRGYLRLRCASVSVWRN
jgi:lipopolysaccharide transport system ATP-binding protein